MRQDRFISVPNSSCAPDEIEFSIQPGIPNGWSGGASTTCYTTGGIQHLLVRVAVSYSSKSRQLSVDSEAHDPLQIIDTVSIETCNFFVYLVTVKKQPFDSALLLSCQAALLFGRVASGYALSSRLAWQYNSGGIFRNLIFCPLLRSKVAGRAATVPENGMAGPGFEHPVTDFSLLEILIGCRSFWCFSCLVDRFNDPYIIKYP